MLRLRHLAPVMFTVPHRSFTTASDQKTGNQKTVYVVRHGEAGHNVVDSNCPRQVVWGRRRDPKLIDPHLTSLGEAQAISAAKSLATQLAEHHEAAPTVIVSSTLRRALKTAELAACPVAAPGAQLIALEEAAEIQFGDIWNEPRDPSIVRAEWPQWTVELLGKHQSMGHGTPRLETADDMIKRAEAVWKQLNELESPVIVLVAHGAFLYFLLSRLAVADSEQVINVSFMGNAEARRLCLPQPDGRQMKFKEVVEASTIPQEKAAFWYRFSKRANALRNAENVPSWAQTEWRYAKQDEAFDCEL